MKQNAAESAVGLLVTVCLITLFAMPALAQEEEEGTTTTTSTMVQVIPAVPIETPTTPPGAADWTYRFLIPTGLVLAAVVILITSIRYFTNVVRKRYRIVEE